MPRRSDVGPILEGQAKDEDKHRLDDLRKDLEEAERFNEISRAERAREEMDALAEQLAAAVGLGGWSNRPELRAPIFPFMRWVLTFSDEKVTV